MEVRWVVSRWDDVVASAMESQVTSTIAGGYPERPLRRGSGPPSWQFESRADRRVGARSLPASPSPPGCAALVVRAEAGSSPSFWDTPLAQAAATPRPGLATRRAARAPGRSSACGA